MMPRATIRLQLSRDFTLMQAIKHVPYYADLGLSHLYLSPVTRSREGSTHGYDVIDYSCVDPELGGESALVALAECVHEYGMGLILDIVPNHMAAHPDNPWWRSVLQNGQDSAFAQWFDIQWQPALAELQGKILLPVLGSRYGDALDQGDIRLVFDAASSSFLIDVQGLRLPLAPGSITLDAGDTVEDTLIAHDFHKPEGKRALHDVLERQHYRLSWWQCAADQINWRRFFEVSELVGIRVENDDVFQAVHELPLRLFTEGLIDGLRIDHVDGMAYPIAYCERLHNALWECAAHRPGSRREQEPWLIVEKILAHDEALDYRWKVHGDSGYEFMDAVSAVIHDADGKAPLTRQWEIIAQDERPAAAWLRDARRLMVQRHFVAERNALVETLYQLSQTLVHARDWSRRMLGRATDELLIAFPVYRIYVSSDGASDDDIRFLHRAGAQAREQLLASRDFAAAAALDVIVDWMKGEIPQHATAETVGLLATAMRRFQQLTPPLAAKAQEDTVFYRYGRLLSRNEVGSEPARFSMPILDFHRWNERRADAAPFSMLATATHDHKRGEDAGARLAVISEAPAHWQAFSSQCMAVMSGRLAQRSGVQGAQRYMMLQTLVAAWPPCLDRGDQGGLAAFSERLKQWQIKALREAKQASSWFYPDEETEEGASELIEFLLVDPSGQSTRNIVADFVDSIAPAGVVNSLAFVVLRCTVPGIPDLYQGTELWDFSLVDPDNRRPVDMEKREDMLHTSNVSPPSRLPGWRDGAVKQAVLMRCLHLRQQLPGLFADGDYRPVTVTGPKARHAIAFIRSNGDAVMLVVVSRLAWQAIRDGDTPELPLIPADFWGDTALALPPDCAQRRWRDVLSDHVHGPVSGAMHMAAVLSSLPVAVLVAP